MAHGEERVGPRMGPGGWGLKNKKRVFFSSLSLSFFPGGEALPVSQ